MLTLLHINTLHTSPSAVASTTCSSSPPAWPTPPGATSFPNPWVGAKAPSGRLTGSWGSYWTAPKEATHISGSWWLLKWGRKVCALVCQWPACTVSGVWWHKYVRLKMFQGVLGSYKIAGRDNYVNWYKSTSGSIVLWKLVGSMSMSWTTRAEGEDAKPISQIRPTFDL